VIRARIAVSARGRSGLLICGRHERRGAGCVPRGAIGIRSAKYKSDDPAFGGVFLGLRGGDSCDVPRGLLDDSRGTGRVRAPSRREPGTQGGARKILEPEQLPPARGAVSRGGQIICREPYGLCGHCRSARG